MFRILIPVDFEASTFKACEYALKLAAAAPGAEILLLHCFKDYLASPWEVPEEEDKEKLTPTEKVTEQVINRNEREEHRKLEGLRQELQSKAGSQQVHLKTSFAEGSPEDVIPEEIRRFRPELVVMGTEGEGGLTRSIFGTVTTKVAEDVQVPVLTVPQHSRGHRIKRVLYASDYDEKDSAAIRTLQQLLQPFNPHILCLHIATGAAAQEEREKLAHLQAKLERDIHTDNVRFLLLEGQDVTQDLQHFVEKEQVDLLAVTTHKRSLLAGFFNPSLTKKLMLTADIPLLVFHSKD
ncbi:universal stress protein [Pontibacter toksunensis]|uniref:Universal stress protein n=1 Tax=Pontibacter toksunensis TaxID=1332631 RepID=A0ABW6BXG9_9BACT